MATYRTCVADAKTQKQELEDTKVTALRQIQEVIRQSDQTIKSVSAVLPPPPPPLSGWAGRLSVQPQDLQYLGPLPPACPQATISYYQMMHMQTAPLPVHFHMLCESSKLYDPGQQYASHVRQLQRGEEPDVHYDFEPHVSANTWYPAVCACPGEPDFPPEVGAGAVSLCDPHRGPFFLAVGPTRSPVLRARKGSFNVSDAAVAEAAGCPPEEGGLGDGELAKERRGECTAGAGAAPLQPPSALHWGHLRRWARTPGAQVVADRHLRL